MKECDLDAIDAMRRRAEAAEARIEAAEQEAADCQKAIKAAERRIAQANARRAVAEEEARRFGIQRAREARDEH